MADDSRETDSTSIDSAINELAERKNDIGSDKPSTSTPQKRPSPNSTEHQLTSKRLNTLLPPSPPLPSSLNITNQSAIERATDEETDDNNHHGDTIESDEMDVLAAIVTQKSRSIEKTAATIDTMCINAKLYDRNFMREFEMAWLPSMELNLTDRSGNKTADSNDIEKSTQPNCTKFNSDSVKLYQKPFRICVMSEFLENPSFTRQLVEDMCKMEWQRKQMDLYEFHQTTDLSNLSATAAKPALKQFYSLLTDKMLPWMRQITGLSLSRVSASCSMYNHGDYLLVHDDLLSDRQIAFVFYLSPWLCEWTEQMGGALELFESDLRTGQPKYPTVEKFPPRNNQFVFFRVCKQSFHQVGEVTNLVYPRLTINGWFHGSADAPPSHADIMSTADSIEEMHGGSDSEDNSMEVNVGAAVADQEQAYHVATQDDLDLNEWINPYYLRQRVKQDIQQHIEDKSEASLEMFLIAEFFDTLSTEFKSSGMNWILEGPANQRKYERLHFARNSTGPLKDLYTLFTSESMFELLQEYTELDLSGLNADRPTCSVQLCRFTQGCYTLLGDSTTFADSALDVILFFNARDGSVGKITYLSPSQGIGGGGVSTEYNTTTETDITTATTNTTATNTFTSNYATDQSSIVASDISSSSSTTIMKNNAYNQKQPKQSKKISKQQTATTTKTTTTTTTLLLDQSHKNSSCDSANNSSSIHCMMDTSDDDVSNEMMSDDGQATSTKQKSSTTNQSTAKNNACKVTVRADVHEQNSGGSESFDIDGSLNDGGNSSECGGGGGRGNMADNDSEDTDYEELAQENALLTIHPKNNSLNLVYRLSGQTKFVKYISKNSLKPDEYIYILFASYKE